MFLMFTGNTFHKIAPWYKALFLYFSQLGITVLKSGAPRGGGGQAYYTFPLRITCKKGVGGSR